MTLPFQWVSLGGPRDCAAFGCVGKPAENPSKTPQNPAGLGNRLVRATLPRPPSPHSSRHPALRRPSRKYACSSGLCHGGRWQTDDSTATLTTASRRVFLAYMSTHSAPIDLSTTYLS